MLSTVDGYDFMTEWAYFLFPLAVLVDGVSM